MKVLLVIDQYDGVTNGTTMTARRLAECLRRRSHEVRIASSGPDREGIWGFGEFRIPVFDPLVKAQGYVFAGCDEAKMRQAVGWADLVHVLMPFPLEKLAVKVALDMDKPLTAGYHLQPENIWYSVGLGHLQPLLDFTYVAGRKYIFKYIKHIHCPSNMIRDVLASHGFRAELHVISNGYSDVFRYQKRPKRKEFEGKFVIVMSGRISNEKRQDILIEAVRRSRHSKDIQLFLAGQGPVKDRIAKLGATLPNPVMMGFLTTAQMVQLLSEADLFGYPSDVDIESISCLEAVASGLVPVISDSKSSAASQFALDERSVFRSGDIDGLSKKIDYWIEHEEERKRMEKEYAAFAKATFSLDVCIDRMIDMFDQEMQRHGKRFC